MPQPAPHIIRAVLTAVAALAGLAAAPVAAADRLLCLGVSPRFVLTIEGAEVTFDYAGDGTFRLDPPLTGRYILYRRHSLVTARQRWPLVLEARDCRVSTLTLPVRVEVRVPTAAGPVSYLGCCFWRGGGDGASPGPGDSP
jgi:hypothetical protein